jgi:serine/threonine protein kinase
MQNHQFQIIRKIGAGEFGNIYLAQLPGFREQVVIKKVDARHECKEHEILTATKHPNIICILDTIHEEKTISLILEYASKGRNDITQGTFPAS